MLRVRVWRPLALQASRAHQEEAPVATAGSDLPVRQVPLQVLHRDRGKLCLGFIFSSDSIFRTDLIALLAAVLRAMKSPFIDRPTSKAL